MNHIFYSKSGDGYLNLAADELILERYRRGELDGVTLYFYVNDNAVIIGRNQNAWAECDIVKMEADGVQLVRRHTGGGAVYHDGGNLNFSFITNEKLYDKERQNRVILNALRRLGYDAEVLGRNDFTVGGRKVSGCAYALSGVARGMHGTLLVCADMDRLSEYLKPSKLKLSVKGIGSVRARVCNLNELKPLTVQKMREAVAVEFGLEYGEHTPLDIGRAYDILCAKHEEIGTNVQYDDDELVRLYKERSSWEWRIGRNPQFEINREGRLSFGMVQIMLTVRNGVVRSSKVYSDALDVELPVRIQSLLEGARFERDGLFSALSPLGSVADEITDLIMNNEVK